MTSYHGYDPELYSLGLRYTLSKDFLDSHFALLLDMYKYLRVQMLFIQKYDNILKFLLWNASSSLSGFITWLKNNLRDFALQQICMITLKNCTRYSKWLLNGEMMSTFPTLNLPKSVLLLFCSCCWVKMKMCQWSYLGFFPFHQFQLHFFHRYMYVYFNFVQMGCMNQCISWYRLQVTPYFRWLFFFWHV